MSPCLPLRVSRRSRGCSHETGYIRRRSRDLRQGSNVEMLGSEVWRAVSFYFDVKLVSREPTVFARLLDKLFGASSKALQQRIGETLFSKLGGQEDRSSGREFQEWIQMAWARFSASARFAMPLGKTCFATGRLRRQILAKSPLRHCRRAFQSANAY